MDLVKWDPFRELSTMLRLRTFTACDFADSLTEHAGRKKNSVYPSSSFFHQVLCRLGETPPGFSWLLDLAELGIITPRLIRTLTVLKSVLEHNGGCLVITGLAPSAIPLESRRPALLTLLLHLPEETGEREPS